MHFKVGDQGLTCAWHPENDNGSASLHLLERCSHRDTKPHWLLPQGVRRKCSFRRRPYIKEEGYVYSIQILASKISVRGRGDRVAAASWYCPFWLLRHQMIRYNAISSHTTYLPGKKAQYLVHYKTNRSKKHQSSFKMWTPQTKRHI